jgi:hypothetical protein
MNMKIHEDRLKSFAVPNHRRRPRRPRHSSVGKKKKEKKEKITTTDPSERQRPTISHIASSLSTVLHPTGWRQEVLYGYHHDPWAILQKRTKKCSDFDAVIQHPSTGSSV